MRSATTAIQAKTVITASRKVALPHGSARKRTNSAAAVTETSAVGHHLGSRRTASAIAKGASTPVTMINKKAKLCTQPFHVSGCRR